MLRQGSCVFRTGPDPVHAGVDLEMSGHPTPRCGQGVDELQ